jgi:hypothetical protein
MRSFTAIAGIAGLCCEITLAQIGATPRFDVASIRRSAPDSDTFMKAHPGGRLEISRATLRTLIALAFRLQPFQVSGGPAWVRSEYFDVNTKAAVNPSEDQLLLMTQVLLRERFSLQLHFETAERPVYILVPGKTGRTRPAGLQVSTEGSFEHGRYNDASIMFRKSIQADRKFGPAYYQLALTSDAITLPPDMPSIFTALQEQLGLRLEPGKAAIELLVIDHAERPGAN